ncbi:putative YkwD family protein [Fontibacillus phaseoli]|uniref:Putative YkwD family protein n=1 Tax=Fontibacillus phaseoli TaxID=1416533 RepID=A0A369B7B2_9BACL|nr:CAP domain-containing protein [Fontibacillus phaseoli]RCX17403.1 putative YkwD family protein [Fontibacillus phaseoli]
MRTTRMRKHLITGGLTAILAAGLVLPASASAASNNHDTTNTTSYWKTYFYSIPWNEIYKQQPVQNGNQGTTGGTNGTVQNGNSGNTSNTGNTTNSGSSSQSGSSTDKSQFATQVITLVNQERAKQGLKPLAGNAELNNMALAKAKDMSQNNYFDHTSPTYGSPFDMMKKFGISYSYAGENIAMGQKTPAEVVNAWMNSAGHRANILNANYNLIGVGYYNGYWAQEFVGR